MKSLILAAATVLAIGGVAGAARAGEANGEPFGTTSAPVGVVVANPEQIGNSAEAEPTFSYAHTTPLSTDLNNEGWPWGPTGKAVVVTHGGYAIGGTAAVASHTGGAAGAGG